MRRLSLALGLAVLLGIYLVAARARHDGGGSPYVTMPVERGPITARVTATGSVNPVKTVQVGTYVSGRSEEHTSELQSQSNLVCRLLLEKKKLRGHHRSSQQLSNT